LTTHSHDNASARVRNAERSHKNERARLAVTSEFANWPEGVFVKNRALQADFIFAAGRVIPRFNSTPIYSI